MSGYHPWLHTAENLGCSKQNHDFMMLSYLDEILLCGASGYSLLQRREVCSFGSHPLVNVSDFVLLCVDGAPWLNI